MRIVLEGRDLVKYPFLKEAQQYIKDYAASIHTFLPTKPGELALRSAHSSIEASLSFRKSIGTEIVVPDYPHDNAESRVFIAGYALARILLSCYGDRNLIERFCVYQSWLFYHHIQTERASLVQYIAEQFGMEYRSHVIPVSQYIGIIASVSDPHWRLINRHVISGQVFIEPEEFLELLRERLASILREQLPLRIPEEICSLLAPSLDEIKVLHQERMFEEFGPVDDEAYPPCISNLLLILTKGGHLSHMARFAGTSFLHNIGMDSVSIVELYGNAPGFDLERTSYQVNHIAGDGGSGTDYTSPMCATMKTHGLCVHADALCATINHPLTYYKRKKADRAKKERVLLKNDKKEEKHEENEKTKERPDRNSNPSRRRDRPT